MRRTKAMAKFFSLLSLAGEEEDKWANGGRETMWESGEGGGMEEKIGAWKKEKKERGDRSKGRKRHCVADLHNQVCVMTPWVIFQIASNHPALSELYYSQGIRREEVRVLMDALNRQTEEQCLLLTLLG